MMKFLGQITFPYLILMLLGCGESHDAADQPTTIPASGNTSSVFWDDVETNIKLPMGIDELTFVDTLNNQVKVTDYFGKKHLVLVFTRGFSGRLCPFCRIQSSRLVANYGEFANRDAEVLLVYPGDSEHLGEFIDAAKTTEKKQVDQIPFPILLDSDLKAVNYLEIAADLAFPSTYILDKEGKVRFAYVGEAPNDRPSIKALLGQLDILNQ